MTDEKDGPVHYQVSVTGRQAATFFLVLLAALGLSFFFGMKTGAAAKRGPDPVSALTAQSDIPVKPDRVEGERDEPATPVPTEVPIGFAKPEPEPAREPVAKPEPTAAEEPKVVVKEEPLPASAEPKAGGPAPKPVRTPVRPAEPAAQPADGPFWVQVFVTSSAEKADDLAKKLKSDGFRPDVSLVAGKKSLFRVRVGPYDDRAKAEAGASRVEKLRKLETTIVPAGK